VGLLSIILGLAVLALPGCICLGFGGTDWAASRDSWAPVFRGITVHGAILCAMSVALIVVGIGQLRGRAWADRWSRTWGIAALAAVAAMIALSLWMTGPALNAVTSAPPVTTMWEAPLFELILFPHQLPPVWRAVALAGFYGPYPLVLLSRHPRVTRPGQLEE
jgi:hypothetical protein